MRSLTYTRNVREGRLQRRGFATHLAESGASPGPVPGICALAQLLRLKDEALRAARRFGGKQVGCGWEVKERLTCGMV